MSVSQARVTRELRAGAEGLQRMVEQWPRGRLVLEGPRAAVEEAVAILCDAANELEPSRKVKA